MKVLSFVYNSAAKASSSVSIGLLALGIIAGTVACQRQDATTGQQESQKPASSPTVPKEEPIKLESPVASKTPPNSNSPGSSRTLPDTQSQKIQPAVVQQEEGRLRLVNDTPYTSVVYIYDSAGESYRYVHVPACATRELYDTYSNSQFIRLNADTTFPIAQKAKREDAFLAIKMSALADNSEQQQLCKFTPYKASNINLLEFGKDLLERAAKHGAKAEDAVKATAKATAKTQTYSDNLLSELRNLKKFVNKGTLVNPKTIDAFESFTDVAKNEVVFLRDSESIAEIGDVKSATQKAADIIAMRAFGAQDDNQALQNLVSHARLEFESGAITSESELKEFFVKRIKDPDCVELYRRFTVDDKVVKFTFKIFTILTKVSVEPVSNDSPPTGQVAQIEHDPSRVKNVQAYEFLQAQPKCASTRTNKSVLIPISDHARSRFQKVLQ